MLDRVGRLSAADDLDIDSYYMTTALYPEDATKSSNLRRDWSRSEYITLQVEALYGAIEIRSSPASSRSELPAEWTEYEKL